MKEHQFTTSRRRECMLILHCESAIWINDSKLDSILRNKITPSLEQSIQQNYLVTHAPPIKVLERKDSA
jgi:hypothetical protein